MPCCYDDLFHTSICSLLMNHSRCKLAKQHCKCVTQTSTECCRCFLPCFTSNVCLINFFFIILTTWPAEFPMKFAETGIQSAAIRSSSLCASRFINVWNNQPKEPWSELPKEMQTSVMYYALILFAWGFNTTLISISKLQMFVIFRRIRLTKNIMPVLCLKPLTWMRLVTGIWMTSAVNETQK